MLLGKSDVSAREAHYFYLQYKLQAVRSGPWKLALVPQIFSMGMMNNPKGETHPGLRLYNLAKDVGETTNVADQNPEVVTKLKTLADQRNAAFCNDSSSGPGIRPHGMVDNPQPLYPMAPEAMKKGKNGNKSADDHE